MSYRHIIVGLIVGACAASVSVPHASAAGALALGQSNGGVWYGINSDSGSVRRARARAMRNCEQHGPCPTVRVFWNKCFALALQGPGLSGWGWATRDFQGAAQREAIRACESYGRSCTIAYSGCDKAGR
jgi:hypothetical protein